VFPHGRMFKKWESNPWRALKMGVEPMTCWCCELEQNHCLIILVVNIWLKGVNWNQTNVQEWESNPKNLYMWKSKTFLWVKMVNESRSIGWKWELNPWTCVWHLSNDLLFFYRFVILYTLVLVMVILKFWWMAKGAYEAGHCLHGHHKFG
jgi:hypothetical protein